MSSEEESSSDTGSDQIIRGSPEPRSPDIEHDSPTASLAGTTSKGDEEDDGDYDGDYDDGYEEEYEEDGASMHRRGSYAPTQHPRARSPPRPGSTMDYSDLAASTRSLWAQDLDYREIHGRRYCKEYFMPNDDIEQLRLALMHQVFLHVLDGELTTVPLDDPDRILDVGCGTGDWAMRMAELWPDCEIVGTDISAIAETNAVPMNVFFEIEDAEDWDRPLSFYDFIHLRTMEGSFRDWPELYDNVWDSLKPHGWIEVTDFDTTECFARFMSLFSKESSIHGLFRDSYRAAERSGRPRGTAHLDHRLLMQAGYVEVRVVEHVIPITIAEKSAGKIWLITWLDAFEAMFLRPLTEHMGWDPDECKAACEAAAREMAEMARDPEMGKGLYVKLRTITGRKPMGDRRSDMGGDSGQAPRSNLTRAQARKQSPGAETMCDSDES